MFRYEVDGARANLVLDDPERRNPLSGSAMQALHDGLESAIDDDSVRVVVITGAGEKAFSAGGDLAGGFFDDPIGLHAARGVIGKLFRLMRRGGKPIIARVNGHALAGGFGLAAACDIVVAVESAKMGTTEVKVGLWPMQISAILQRVMPARQALELYLTGRIITAEEAHALGVVTRLAPDLATLDQIVDDYVDVLSSLPSAAVRFGRDTFYTIQDMGIDAALDHLQTGLTLVTMTDDAVEGVGAFIDKRTPEWSGH